MRYIVENKEYQLNIAKRGSLMRAPHLHRHLEMIYMQKGRAGVLLDGKEFIMEEGDAFLSFPNQIHGYDPKTPVEVVVVIFSRDLEPEMGGLLKNKAPVDPVVKAADLPKDTRQRMEQCDNYRRKTDYIRP